MHITPYLYFEGTCRAAFVHYQHVLGGELMLTTYAQCHRTLDLACRSTLRQLTW
ncbi:hypothetical protein MUG10_12730 [Xanthomonas prunicola]|uniref:VOC family protein n=1 Tax=Xanthomonas prunicola TaxID=2053930 RepID=A0A9Q9IUU0_9XANT|nr:hypothetical protein [Xanthomonas prunicola]USI98977.1 hypothetical protein MUG10_12730 [Xanthomonas prunicola]UXA47393.1 hypothetical protein M0D44_13575 [Xanthomonas prunicola]UXA54753.1 hypothetical protein M0D45_08600 [Xanthomonas prunicola]UXA55853.1 hypothetical protein M0D47_13515 [Xanthomonas prunicola]UXA61811.1 hypothetical protein M0D48_01905 [Xanthomonas prunicola]